MSNFESVYKKAKKFYFEEWRGHEKKCPAFEEKIYITTLGWKHIVGKPRRTIVDKVIRLKKLPLAKELLEKATTYQTVQKRGNYYLFGFQAIKSDTLIKVVVSAKGQNGRKVFYSAMFKNIYRSEQKKIDQHNLKLIKSFKRGYSSKRRTRR